MCNPPLTRTRQRILHGRPLSPLGLALWKWRGWWVMAQWSSSRFQKASSPPLPPPPPSPPPLEFESRSVGVKCVCPKDLAYCEEQRGMLLVKYHFVFFLFQMPAGVVVSHKIVKQKLHQYVYMPNNIPLLFWICSFRSCKRHVLLGFSPFSKFSIFPGELRF